MNNQIQDPDEIISELKMIYFELKRRNEENGNE